MLIEDIDLVEHEPRKTVKSPGRPRYSLKSATPPKRKFSKKELRIFAASLSSMLEGGIPLLRAIQLISRQFKNKNNAAMLLRIEQSIRQGKGLSEALEAEARDFPLFFVQMTAAGELSGNLGVILGRLAAYLKKQEDRRRKIIEALTYPAIVFFLGIITFFVMLKFVIPQIMTVYDDFDGKLPLLTRWALAASDHVLLIGAGVLASAWGVYFYGKREKDRLLEAGLRLPVLGPLMHAHLTAFFCSLLALELLSGITILRALESIRKTLPWKFFQRDLTALKETLAQGASLGESLQSMEWMSENARVLVQSGQESGRLTEALEQVGQEASVEFDNQIQFALKLLEPALILGVGIFVGLIIISAILPILEINSFVR